MVRRAVFLDRDGVINESIIRDGKPFPPSSVKQTVITADVKPSLTRLKQHGFLLLVVTNQPDVRRGACSRADVEQIHGFLSEQLPVDDFFVCYHDDEDRCSCRKPLPGLLIEAAGKYGVNLKDSYLIGDRWRDIDAGAAAGCQTIIIEHGYRERGPSVPPNMSVGSVSKAVDWILAREALVKN